MKAPDLMVGNLVQLADDYYDIPKGTVFKVIEIYADTIFAQDIEGAYEGMEFPEYKLEPIPLTPKILVKNGFKQTGIGGGCIIGEYAWGGIWDRKSTTVTITFYKGLSSGVALLTKIETTCSHEGGVNMVHSCDIENVHELQHALRLCGIEKEIVL